MLEGDEVDFAGGVIAQHLVDLGGRDAGDVVAHHGGDLGVEALFAGGDGFLVDEVFEQVEVGVALDFFVGHEAEGAGVAGGAPGGVVEGVEGHGVGDGAVEVFGVGLETVDGGDVGLEAVDGELHAVDVVLRGFVVDLKFFADVGAGFGDEMAVVEVLDEGFEGERDEEADGDDGEMEEESSRQVWMGS